MTGFFQSGKLAEVVLLNIVISNPKTGKAFSKKIDEPSVFYNKKIGEIVKLDAIGMEGFEAKITGGSDKTGTPMKADLPGTFRRKVFIQKGFGFKKTKTKGIRKRKVLRGNTVSNDISQLNLAIVKEGSKKLEEFFAKEEKTEEKKESFKEKAIQKSMKIVEEGAEVDSKGVKGKVKKK